jgi:Fe-Mn family superoxide dismutase
MPYEAKNFDHLLGTDGFSDQLLKNHFTLYQGYVKNTNTLAETLAAMSKEGKTATTEFAELKRRFGWEFNGMRLHELYFGNMKKGAEKCKEGTAYWAQMDADFGATEKSWKNDFTAVGAMRGIGWVVWVYDPMAKRTFNVWVNEHDVGHLAGCVPLLVMDVFEHAFMLDYGLKRADYIAAFMAAVDWNVVGARLEAAQ